MRVEVVTSCSPDGLALYGRACVSSFLQYWTLPITVYLDVPDAIEGADVRMTGDIPRWRETSRMLPVRNRHADKPDSYLWNAHRYAVKPFVWRDAAKRLERGILAWLDADTLTTKPVPATIFADMLGDADVAYLGRRTMHPENGCVVFRVPEALPLLAWCQKGYGANTFRKWADGWTDCHVLKRGMSAVGIRARDLTSSVHRGLWRSHVDAFALSPLGAYMVHLKGKRQKREGRLLGINEYKPSWIDRPMAVAR